MTPTPVLILLAAALGGCASATAKSLPVCDGQHRRPANPYGSVLEPSPPPTAAAPGLSPRPATPPPTPPAAEPPGCGA
jgi:hypothetical protein